MTKQLFRGLALFAALALMLCGCTAKPAADSGKDYLATEFGAVADGVTLNTASVQAAIDYISANGGGRLVFTPGTFVCGSIYLKNNVTLHLQKDAVLLGSLNPWDFIRDTVAHWTAFVLSVDQENIGVTGEGTLDCRGFQVANNLVQYVHLGLLEDPLGLDRVQEVKRPELIHFFRCRNITMKDITLKDPASWTQQYDQCDGLLVEGMKVDAKCYWNNDGIDVVDSKNVTIRNCYIDSADDSYCFKSHSASGVSENILVENCIGRSSANGVKFGTYTRGTFKHFRFKNIKIFDTYRSAFTVASVDGASIEDVEIDGLQSLHTGNPFFIRLASRHEGEAPCLKDVVIKNVYAEVPFEKPDAGYSYEGPVEDLPRNVCPSIITGIPGLRIDNVRFENVEIVYPGQADSTYAYRGTSPEELAAIPELERSYPEFSNWKELPAWGFYIRHADGISFQNVKIKVAGEDYRPAVVADDVNGLKMTNFVISQADAAEGKQQIITNNVTDFECNQ